MESKHAPPESHLRDSGRERVPMTSEQAPHAGGKVPATKRLKSFAEVFGALRGTVKMAPGTNLTDPIDEDWDAAR